MKFEELYKRVYLTEQDEAPKDEVADTGTTEAKPEDFQDVEPMPQPETEVAPATPEGQTETQSGLTLMDYVNKLDEVSDMLLNLEGDCLQKLVQSLDKPGTPFDGIASRATEIARTSEVLSSLSGKLKMYIISSGKL